MISFLTKNFPNVVALGWGGDAGWGTAIFQTLFIDVYKRQVVMHRTRNPANRLIPARRFKSCTLLNFM